MIFLSRRTGLALGTLAAGALFGPPVVADDFVRAADRCAIYGTGYAELSDGTCGRLRIGDPAPNREWRGAPASNAGLRSDGLGMLPGADNARHLRIQVDPDFR